MLIQSMPGIAIFLLCIAVCDAPPVLHDHNLITEGRAATADQAQQWESALQLRPTIWTRESSSLVIIPGKDTPTKRRARLTRSRCCGSFATVPSLPSAELPTLTSSRTGNRKPMSMARRRGSPTWSANRRTPHCWRTPPRSCCCMIPTRRKST